MFSKIQKFLIIIFLIIGFTLGLGFSVLAWINPSQSPPNEGGIIQTDTSGLKIVTTTQITSGNLIVTSSGKVGIGTMNPGSLLFVLTNNTGKRQISTNNWIDISAGPAGYGAVMGNAYYDNNGTFNYWYYANTHNSIGAIGFAVNYPNFNQASVITSGVTSSASGATFTPSVIATFDYTGNVGIGTTVPKNKLDVNGGMAVGSYAGVNIAPSNGLIISGNVGIGTTVPDEKLVVSGGGIRITGLQNSSRLYFSNSNTDKTKYIATEDYWLTFGAYISEGFRFKDQNGNTQAQIGLGSNNSYILNNVGIGTTSPENSENWNRVLDVYGASHSKVIVTTNNVQTGLWSHNLGFYGAPAGGIAGTKTNHPFTLITNAQPRLTIANNGNIGIGQINPQYKLDVNGDVNINGKLIVRGDIDASSNQWGACTWRKVDANRKPKQWTCEAGEYVAGIGYEDNEWTNNNDIHIYPEVDQLYCCKI
jgi:hypothetical protein